MKAPASAQSLGTLAAAVVVVVAVVAQARLTGGARTDSEVPATVVTVAGDDDRCRPENVRFFGSFIGQGSVVVNAGFATAGPPCRLDGRLVMEVTRPNGERVQGIAANPDAVGVRRWLRHPFETSAFAWENWCGDPGPFEVRLTMEEFSLTLPVERLPICGSTEAGSQLRSHRSAALLNEDTAVTPR